MGSRPEPKSRRIKAGLRCIFRTRCYNMRTSHNVEGILFMCGSILYINSMDRIVVVYSFIYLTLWRCFIMQKNKKTTWDTRTVVFVGLLAALHIVLTRVLVIELGSYRISIGSVCTILAGLWLGPVAGGTSGLISDLLGCLIKGYAVNPFITVAAMLWGVIPGLTRRFLAGGRVKKTAVICISVVISAVMSTLVFTTAGLVLMLGYNFYAIMPGRIAQCAIMTPIYCILAVTMYFSPITSMVLNATVRHSNHAAA